LIGKFPFDLLGGIARYRHLSRVFRALETRLSSNINFCRVSFKEKQLARARRRPKKE
jgi:hypothetical protein